MNLGTELIKKNDLLIQVIFYVFKCFINIVLKISLWFFKNVFEGNLMLTKAAFNQKCI